MKKTSLILFIFFGVFASIKAQVSPPPRFYENDPVVRGGDDGGESAVTENKSIQLFGSGTLQGLFSENSEEGNQGTGSIGISISDIENRSQFALGYSLGANTRVTFEDQRSFGNAFLLPGSGGNSFFIDYKIYGLFGVHKLGLAGNITASNQDWEKGDTIYTASPIAPSIGFSYQIFDNTGSPSNNKVLAAVDLRYTSRLLIGDINQEGEFLTSTLGQSDTYYHGIEFSASLWINDTKISASVPVIFSDTQIKGFSNGQLIIGVSFGTDLIKTKL